MIALLGLVFLYATGNVANFDGPLTLYYLFLDIAPILLIALPMTLMIITGEIDLSVASIMGLSSVCSGILHQTSASRSRSPAVLALLVGVLCGAFNGFLVAYVGLPSLAVTIGTLALFRGLAVGLLGTEAITDFPEQWTDLAKERLGRGVAATRWSWSRSWCCSSCSRCSCTSRRSAAASTRSGSTPRPRASPASTSSAPSSGCSCWPASVSAFAGIYYTLRYGSARGDNAEGSSCR